MPSAQYKCDFCGKQFVGPVKNSKWHFCNRECLTQSRKPGGVICNSRKSEIFIRKCLQCGNEFQYTLHNKKKQYCGRECANKARFAGGLIAQKVDATTLQNHGVTRMFCDRERTKEFMQLHHGVNNASNIPGLRKESWKKAHETKKRNGTYKSSKIERDFLEALVVEGCDVEPQVVVLGKPIDITLNLQEKIYVQIDGRYWHGLDRPTEELSNSDVPRDKSIYERFLSDRLQDEQFKVNGLQLVRITDTEAKEWLKQKRKLLPQILGKLSMK